MAVLNPSLGGPYLYKGFLFCWNSVHHFWKSKPKSLLLHASRPLALQQELVSEPPAGSLGSADRADQMSVPISSSGRYWELTKQISQSFPEMVLPNYFIDPCYVPHFWFFSLMWPVLSRVTVNGGINWPAGNTPSPTPITSPFWFELALNQV